MFIWIISNAERHPSYMTFRRLSVTILLLMQIYGLFGCYYIMIVFSCFEKLYYSKVKTFSELTGLLYNLL